MTSLITVVPDSIADAPLDKDWAAARAVMTPIGMRAKYVVTGAGEVVPAQWLFDRLAKRSAGAE